MSSGFISEAELAEAKKKRQEEWEKVRKPDDPEEKPEEPYDGRSLYERLKEQKDKKDLEFEESRKLKNLIRGLDDDEIDFLDMVDQSKMNAEKAKHLQDLKELQEFRERQNTIDESQIDRKRKIELEKPKISKNLSSSHTSQKSILKGVIVRKREAEGSSRDEPAEKKGLVCLGVLPGIGKYDSSDESDSSYTDIEEMTTPCCLDLVGRKILKKSAEECK
ncbi:PSME3-interacting protein [Phlebotomus argentipes]|uniref:PSME3-interacting protein n=1 Tax=Phlebotomus argentipes TaxID=94469 RepID=UPI002892D720|nr:PSME3-interacting protein [Phlebotomus argentipes]